MADFEFAVCVKDEADLASGHKRMKQGDIIAVKPAPWNWGKKEVDQFLVVPVSGLTKEEAHDLCQPSYAGGVLQKDLPTDIDAEPVAMVGKRRYSIPMATIKKGWKADMVTADVEDKKKVYQPLKDAKVKIDFSEKVQICKDNFTGSFKYSAEKNSFGRGVSYGEFKTITDELQCFYLWGR